MQGRAPLPQPAIAGKPSLFLQRLEIARQCVACAFGEPLGAEMVRLGWAVATSDAYMVEETEVQA